ncbi:MAG: MFS transporter, partial [Planctomycetaceae bacterium]
QVVWTLWFTYGVFYFCRTNISAAVPGMKSPAADGGLGLSGDEVGWILASLKIAYGLGQLVNGQVAERIPARYLLAVGMFGSAALNVLFGLGTGFYFLLFVWACNGYCQSLGWTPCMRVIGNWIPVSRRGNSIGVIGTGYQITLGLTYFVASWAADVDVFGWRGALFVPSMLLAAGGGAMLLLLKESPNQPLDSPLASEASRPVDDEPAPLKASVSENIYLTLFNPSLWLMGLSLGLLNACRYGFLDWGLTHLMEVQDTGVGKAGLKYVFIAVGAAAGAYISGWATDRFFGGRRIPVIAGLLVALGVLTLAYEAVARYSGTGTILLLVVIGFCIYGPQVLLVGTAPADFAHRRTTAAAAGFVNFMGYMGAATGDVVTGHFSAETHGGWQVAIWIWAGWAFTAAVFTSLLWNASEKDLSILPAFVPRLTGTFVLVVAGWSILVGDYALWPAVMLLIAAVAMTATFVNRNVAWPCLGAAVWAILYLFANYATGDSGVTWNLAAGLACSGIAVITSVMILVDRR